MIDRLADQRVVGILELKYGNHMANKAESLPMPFLGFSRDFVIVAGSHWRGKMRWALVAPAFATEKELPWQRKKNSTTRRWR